MADGAAYYARLEAGARYLAETTSDPVERAKHLKMARVYRSRSLDASEPLLSGTLH